MSKISQIQETRVVDENGEITTHQQTKTFILEQEPPYVKMYLDTILYLQDLPKSYNPVLISILKRMPWANQCQDISITAGTKRRMAKELGVSVSRINHAITDFIKGKLLFRVETGVYQVNENSLGAGNGLTSRNCN